MIYRTTQSTGRQKAASGDRNAAEIKNAKSLKFGGQLTEFQQLNAPDKLVIFALAGE